MTGETFSYYLSEAAYVPGACTASATKTVEDAKITNPDDHTGACGCIDGADFDNRADAAKRCCGDDSTDCGMISKGSLCAVDANFRNAQWNLPVAGSIVAVGCESKEYLSVGTSSVGTSWVPCGSTQSTLTVRGHEYLCSDGAYTECAGSEACRAQAEGKCIHTGSSISASSQTMYCLSTKRFSTDLDTTDRQNCEGAKNPDGTPGNFKWTGTKCCSEADDPHEYYNDQTGGCWDSEPVISVNFINDTNNSTSVVNYQGKFYGCAVAQGNYNTGNDAYLSHTDKHTGQQLLTDAPYCAQDPTGTYYCSFREKWLATGGQDRSSFQSAPTTTQNTATTSQSECCAPSQCWNGQSCIGDQSSDPTGENALSNLRCINESWQQAVPKPSLNGDAQGFCPQQSQCFVNPNGDPEDNGNPSGNPQCILQDQFIRDDFCASGSWSTRTTQIALQMLAIREQGDFTLFCDRTENTLNLLDYLAPSGQQASTYFGDNANNVCVLKQGSSISVGASFNVPFTDTAALDLFGVQSCSGAQQQDGQYHKCDAAGNLWYNKKLESIIFSKTPLSLEQPDPSFLNSFFITPLANLISTLTQMITNPSFPISNFEGRIAKFQRLYIAEHGSKSIFGVLQGDQATIEYTNFNDINICDFTRTYTQRIEGSNAGIECVSSGQTYKLLLQGGQLTAFQPEQAWPDLTSKVRIS
ncbi:MAG: hypothetical protein HY518_00130 [Candidatus Aenigmarchaeota archaeon]|nr:hypothetical protein [Candidatus Aenigmarchaeota archaeon]